METWNRANSNFRFVESDSHYTVDVVMSAFRAAGEIPAATYLFGADGSPGVANRGEIHRAVITVNRDYPFRPTRWFSFLYADPITIALHELGHVAGLDHSSEQMSVMYLGELGRWEAQRWLSRDEIDGLNHLYGHSPETAVGEERSGRKIPSAGFMLPPRNQVAAKVGLFVNRLLRTRMRDNEDEEGRKL